MKPFPKAASILCLAIQPGFIVDAASSFASILLSPKLVAESALISEDCESNTLFLKGTKNLKSVKLSNFLCQSRNIADAVPGASDNRKIDFYSSLNDILRNQPSIQYKFPLCEHTEAG